MELLVLSIVPLMATLAGAAILHINNLSRVHNLVESMKHCTVTKKDLYKEMTIPQGSNFCALALTGWVMLVVAMAYLYLLVPTDLPVSYMMQIPDIASGWYGFGAYGLFVAALAILVILGLDKLPESHREFKLTELYSFYSLSKRKKTAIALTVPALGVSIICSAYLGTIYPGRSSLAEIIGFALLALSLGLLVEPIYRESWEVRK